MQAAKAGCWGQHAAGKAFHLRGVSQVILAGIDPGVTTGVAVWLPTEKRLRTVDSMTITKAMREVLRLADPLAPMRPPGPLLVVWEDCRKHRVFGAGQRNAGALQGVGSVKRDCGIWEEFLAAEGIPNISRRPRSTRTKLKADQFKAATGWEGKSNNHGRDAAMLVAGVTESMARAWLAEALQRGATA